MRVTHTMIFQNALANMQRQSARLFEAQQQVATGKILQRPSDDPIGTRRALDLRDTLSALEQFERNRQAALSLLQTTETSLDDIETTVQRARSITLEAMNDTVNPENRRLLATEVAGLFEHVMQVGNSAVHGRYIFAGHANTQRPFTATATATSASSGLTTSGTLTPLTATDLAINSVQMRATQAADDTLSTSDHAASAVAIAAVINEALASTGVAARPTTTLSLSVSGFGDLSGNNFRINGVAVTGTISDETSLVAAINAASIPGVVASSAGSGNLTLSAADGRNLQLQSDGLSTSPMNFVDFNLAGGMALDQTTTGVVTLVSDTGFTLGGAIPAQPVSAPDPPI